LINNEKKFKIKKIKDFLISNFENNKKMKRSSRRWKKKGQMRWKWQRKRMKKDKRKRAQRAGKK